MKSVIIEEDVEENTIRLIDDACTYLDPKSPLSGITEDKEKDFLTARGLEFALARFARPVQAVFGLAGLGLLNEDALQIAYLCKTHGKSYERAAALCAVPSDMDSGKCVKLLEVILRA